MPDEDDTPIPPAPAHEHRRNGESDTRRHRRISDTPENGIRVTIPTAVWSRVISGVAVALVTLGGGSGLFASHTSLSAKVDKVLEAQAKIDVDLASFKADTLARLKAVEKRDDGRPR